MPALSAVKSAHSVLKAVDTQITYRSSVRPSEWHNDDELLRSLGYKPEMRREFSSLELFGVAFSIMSLVPSIASVLTDTLTGGLVELSAVASSQIVLKFHTFKHYEAT